MPLPNSTTRYGTVARSLHWLTAALILTAIPLGLYANSLPFDTSEALAAKARVFSLHKTLGVATCLVALARILWAIGQPRPLPLHPGRRLETALAETVHGLLYASLVAVPLSGWIHHADTSGFAPILWPFGDSLPFVPKSERLADLAGTAHGLFTKVLAAALVLHVAGAMKHALIDRDATLARMTRGLAAGPASGAPARRHGRAPLLAAAGLYAACAGLALALTPTNETAPAPAASAATAATTGNWQVTQGTLTLRLAQLGSEVTGTLPGWQAAIHFDPAAPTGNRVTVTLDMASLTLGSVTDQARGPEFLDTATHPAARYEADIRPDGPTWVADGTLTLRGISLPLRLPFSLALDGATATRTGSTTLDRRDFGIGTAYPDEATVGFAVTVDIALTAQRI